MATVSLRTDIAALTTNANLLATAPERFAGPNGARVQLYGVSELNLMSIGLRIGQSIKMTPGFVSVEVAAGRGPVVPDNALAEGIALPGEEIIVEAINGNAAANEAMIRCIITPLPARRVRRR